MNFWTHGFYCISSFVLCFDCPVIYVVYVQTPTQPRLTCGASWVISIANKTLRKVLGVMAETVHRCFQKSRMGPKQEHKKIPPGTNGVKE